MTQANFQFADDEALVSPFSGDDVSTKNLPVSVNALTGLKVQLPRSCQCGHDLLLTGEGKGPHKASLNCARCKRHCGWLSAESADFIAEIIARFGRPTAPIEVRR